MPSLANMLIYAAIALALIGVGAAGAAKHYGPLLRAEHDERISFKAGVEALGRAAEKRTKETNEANAKRKKDADAENGKTKADLAGLYAAYASLRDQRKGAGSGVLPSPSATPGSPAVLTFDRAALDRGLEEADGVLQSGATAILRRGDEAIKNLNTAKKWGSGQ